MGESHDNDKDMFRVWLYDLVTGDKKDTLCLPHPPPWKTFGEWSPP